MNAPSTPALRELLQREPERDPLRPFVGLQGLIAGLKGIEAEGVVQAGLAVATHVMLLWTLVDREDARPHAVVEAAAQLAACPCEPCEGALRNALHELGATPLEVIMNFSPPRPKASKVPWRQSPSPEAPEGGLALTLAMSAVELARLTLAQSDAAPDAGLYSLGELTKLCCLCLAEHRDPNAREPPRATDRLTGSGIGWSRRLIPADCEEIREVMRDALLEWSATRSATRSGE